MHPPVQLLCTALQERSRDHNSYYEESARDGNVIVSCTEVAQNITWPYLGVFFVPDEFEFGVNIAPTVRTELSPHVGTVNVNLK